MEELNSSREITSKNALGSASQFFVAGELCRRAHTAVVTLGNTPNVDILCSNLIGTKFAHIQVKTFRHGVSTRSVKMYGRHQSRKGLWTDFFLGCYGPRDGWFGKDQRILYHPLQNYGGERHPTRSSFSQYPKSAGYASKEDFN
jgi:hypothetical protein